MSNPGILAHKLGRALSGAVAVLSAGQWIATAVLSFGCGVAAFAVARDGTQDVEPVASQTVLRELANPVLTSTEPALVGPFSAHYWREERVDTGDTLGGVIARLGVDDPDLLTFMGSDPLAKGIFELRVGRPLRAEVDENARLVELRFVDNSSRLLSIVRDGDAFKVTTTSAPTEMQWKMAAGQIRSTLVDAVDVTRIPDAVTRQLVDIFAGDFDVYHDLRPGDRFAIVYEAGYRDGEEVTSGRIVAAEFHNRGKAFRAFLYRDRNGNEAYYADDGSPRRGTFLRSPVEFSRITSGFSNARFHPVLHTWRAHKGVDYAAPIGTPIRAAGDGQVTYAGVQGGYGNVVELQHHGAVSTVYAHMADFAPNIEPGTYVKQGDVIGYVGQTGYATGPHLHYEFRVDNEQRDPQTVVMPGADPLAPATRRAFVTRIKPALAELELARILPQNVASAE